MQNIRNYSVAVIGIGGVGSVTAEMLTRCGIGKVNFWYFVQLDKLESNRQFSQCE